MSRFYALFHRLLSGTVTLAIVLGLSLAAAPPRAYAGSDNLFHAEFESAPLGALTAPLPVEIGTVVAQGGNVAVAAISGGRALSLDGSSGQATALLQWDNYPGGLPIGGTAPVSPTTPITLTQAIYIRITGDFTTALSGTTAGSFGLLNGTTFFELFSFGASNALTRSGATIGHFTPGLPVRLDAQIKLKGTSGEVRITLLSGSGSATITVPLGSSFNAGTLNQLRFQAPAGASPVALDHVRVRLQDEPEDDDPPAIIIIKDNDIEQEIERIDGVVFVSIKIKIVNTGGKAKGAFLVLDLDDLRELFDLADISFLEGIGFVSHIDDRQVMIGLGSNNTLYSNGKLQVKIKFKVKHGGVDIKVNAKFKLRFNDTGGEQELALPPVVIVVPVLVVPGLPPTEPISGTVGITPTSGITPTAIVRLPISQIDVRFKGTWDDRGGIDIFGLPLSGPIVIGNGVVVQYFERARLEYHPELSGTRYAVLLGLLGSELGYATPAAAAPSDTVELRWHFKETGHTIGKPFRTFWQNRGGLALFGLPISEPTMENGLLVQYFERERMELHPELAGTRYEIQLGHLGVAVLERTGR
ncbi:MAG TPA: hypothetical protein VFX76_01515 [Roseiflexaceae bacterium]|nr:hypothetical protein [Roseiflexaceae bacterium]